MLKHLATVTDLKSRRTQNTAPDSETADVTTTAATAAENDHSEAKEEENTVRLEPAASAPVVSVVSKEQAMQLLKPGPLVTASRRQKSRSKLDGEADNEAETETEDPSLEGKFVNLVDILLPLPSKGEFDVNKIKSSLYFFS